MDKTDDRWPYFSNMEGLEVVEWDGPPIKGDLCIDCCLPVKRDGLKITYVDSEGKKHCEKCTRSYWLECPVCGEISLMHQKETTPLHMGRIGGPPICPGSGLAPKNVVDADEEFERVLKKTVKEDE